MTTIRTKPAAKAKRFRVLLEKHPGMDAAGITLPFDSVKFFGARGQVPVRCTVNGHTFRTTIFPTGDGAHYMVVNRRARERAGVRGGETITMEMERDEQPRVIKPPSDLARALKAHASAAMTWGGLSYTHRKEYVQWIEEAKRPETRARRIVRAVEALAAGKKERYGRD